MDWKHVRDDLGPEKVVLIHDPAAGLEAIVVIDNTAAGPAIGGIRMALDVSFNEVFRLARGMTFKNAAAGLRHGGGKAGIVADPEMPLADKEPLIRAFGDAVKELVGYIPGPDMGTNETCMGWLHDETGRCVGLPRAMGGIPLDTIGCTAYGLAIATEVADEVAGLELARSRVVIEGFGAVGSNAARFLADRGATIVAVADVHGAVVNPDGLDVVKLLDYRSGHDPVREFPGGMAAPNRELVGLDCDIWVPAARPDVFTATNAADVKARLIVPGANIPATEEAERIFHQRGILMIPDFISNAGGVIAGAAEYHGDTEAQAMAQIEERIRRNTTEVLLRAMRDRVRPRVAAEKLARDRVVEAMGYRRKHC